MWGASPWIWDLGFGGAHTDECCILIRSNDRASVLGSQCQRLAVTPSKFILSQRNWGRGGPGVELVLAAVGVPSGCRRRSARPLRRGGDAVSSLRWGMLWCRRCGNCNLSHPQLPVLSSFPAPAPAAGGCDGSESHLSACPSSTNLLLPGKDFIIFHCSLPSGGFFFFFFFWNANFSGSTKGIGFLEQIATATATSFYTA